MAEIKVLQIGLGPLGLKIAEFIKNRHGIRTVCAVDRNPALIGQSLKDLKADLDESVIIDGTIAEATAHTKPDVAILTTVSDMERITSQIAEVIQHGIPVVSTCEELSYPWDTAPSHSHRIDELAKANEVAVVATGVNPGFLMDALPTFMTAVCQEVESIEVKRIQDAQHRRLPFQKKIGAGLSLAEFEEKKQQGTLRHVGLTESMQLIANRMGWKLDRTEDIIEPIVAEKGFKTADMDIQKGQTLGVQQTGRAFVNDQLKISLIFQAALGAQESFDEVNIQGTPRISSKITHGVNGDIATCAIIINSIPQLLRCSPGLKTMGDLPLVSYFSNC